MRKLERSVGRACSSAGSPKVNTGDPGSCHTGASTAPWWNAQSPDLGSHSWRESTRGSCPLLLQMEKPRLTDTAGT